MFEKHKIDTESSRLARYRSDDGGIFILVVGQWALRRIPPR